MAPTIATQYGRILDAEGKLSPEIQADSDSPMELYWCPPQEYLPMVTAMVKTNKFKPMFIMRVDEKNQELIPYGVVFWASAMTFATRAKVHVLADDSKVQVVALQGPYILFPKGCATRRWPFFLSSKTLHLVVSHIK